MKNNNRPYPRGDKIAMTVRQFVAQIVRDMFPELGITIVDAKASGGLQFVRVFYQGTRQDFEKIKGRIRYELAHRMNQKYVPELDFIYDDTSDVAARIENLLKNT